MELRDHGLSENQGLALLITLVLTAAGGYLFGWKAKERASRKLGMTLIVFVSGLLGCFFLAQAIGMLTDIGLAFARLEGSLGDTFAAADADPVLRDRCYLYSTTPGAQ